MAARLNGKVEVEVKKNGLTYLKNKRICGKCRQYCNVIVRKHMPTKLRQLSDCCSAWVEYGG